MSVVQRVLLAIVFLLATTACDPLTPEERRERLALPKIGYLPDATQGIVKFEQFCMVCHGKNAVGSFQGPPLVNEIYRPGRHADMAFHLATRDGVVQHHWNFGAMPKIEGITPEEVADIRAYIRRLQLDAGIR